MIQSIVLENYKCISRSELDILPLTILAGPNSTGKSSCLQAVLASLYHSAPGMVNILEGFDFSFETLRNRYLNAQALSVFIGCDCGSLSCRIDRNECEGCNTANHELESNIYYLWANRMAYAELEVISPKYRIGISGEYVFGTFEKEKSRPVVFDLRKVKDSDTLSSHLNYWLSYIVGVKLEVQTERVTSSNVKVIYKSDGLASLSPRQLGTGVSYLAKVLIMCLRAQRGDVLMIENPELSLHPLLQSRLGEFFAYIVKAGIQIIIETQSEHLINRLQYEVYKNRLASDDVILYYKASTTADFERMTFGTDGKFEKDFPCGFFDATLDELLEME